MYLGGSNIDLIMSIWAPRVGYRVTVLLKGKKTVLLETTLTNRVRAVELTSHNEAPPMLETV